MQNPVALTADARSLFNAAFKIGQGLGRKFEASDMTIELRQAARQYAATYEGDFSYMLEMRAAVAGTGAFLSDGQAKGVLNCLMADARKRLADRPAKATVAEAAAPQAPARETPIGTFTVVGIDAEHITIRLQKPADKAKVAQGVVYAKYLAGANNDVDFEYFASVVNGQIRARGFERQVAALKVVLASTGSELGKMGMAYALASSNCFYCGRTLTVPASIHSGMGPDCAAKHGGFYGEPEAPTASEEPTSPVIDPETGAQESAEELLDLAAATRHDMYAEADAANRAASQRMAAVRASGRKLTYEDIFGDED